MEFTNSVANQKSIRMLTVRISGWRRTILTNGLIRRLAHDAGISVVRRTGEFKDGTGDEKTQVDAAFTTAHSWGLRLFDRTDDLREG